MTTSAAFRHPLPPVGADAAGGDHTRGERAGRGWRVGRRLIRRPGARGGVDGRNRWLGRGPVHGRCPVGRWHAVGRRLAVPGRGRRAGCRCAVGRRRCRRLPRRGWHQRDGLGHRVRLRGRIERAGGVDAAEPAAGSPEPAWPEERPTWRGPPAAPRSVPGPRERPRGPARQSGRQSARQAASRSASAASAQPQEGRAARRSWRNPRRRRTPTAPTAVRSCTVTDRAASRSPAALRPHPPEVPGDPGER